MSKTIGPSLLDESLLRLKSRREEAKISAVYDERKTCGLSYCRLRPEVGGKKDVRNFALLRDARNIVSETGWFAKVVRDHIGVVSISVAWSRPSV
eukprot:CAMPEP_0197304812 /NCGR_PEP_ID=MMETSP0891-20130614/474_1 /TAXON_ID=44058 ORGANISM="Aureoumbra lagunensis, Strain CCMP1510" /NCGR_SAMPLE_ID=MMETSP0891 /ASSEMBLY_ACC=CAM_ASM_000534 /LENGTH=94 /DNA_ID=CAMNT_0042785147 /DNA_START=43 /DNA_END=327 /DNA_ORIENTATION=-